MFATHKRNLIALSVFFAISAAMAKPVSSAGLVLDFRTGASSLKLRDSSPAKNSGHATAIVVPNSPSLVSMQDTRQFTLAVWIKPNSLPSEFPIVLSKGVHNTSGTNGGYELTLNANGDNDVVFFIGNFYAYTAAANGSVINQHLGEWIHLAITVDANAQTVQIYVNGQPYANVATSGTLADVNFNVLNDLYIGKPDPASSSALSAFDGTIQQVMIYNRTLSADEIQRTFSSTKPK
jgi:Concanavalin A-like lectin/glucanases superfamily